MKRQVLCALLTGVLVSAPASLTVPSAIAVPPDAQGLHDLVVIPPDAHERMFPAVEIAGFEGIAEINIPETLHIHRYYYSGDKEIQGPILHGGPTMIVANHPFCGERMYIRAVLPSGAPRIAYTGHTITYVYPNQRVVVRFHRIGKNKVAVNYINGQGIARNLHQTADHMRQFTAQSLHKSPVAQSVHDTASDAHQLVKGAGITVGGLVVGAIDSARSIAHAVPGVVPLKSLVDQKPELQRDATIRHDQRILDRVEVPFVPTNRN